VTRSRASALGLWLSLVAPSLFVVHKYSGWEGTIVYAILAAVVLALRPALPRRLSDRAVVRLALVTLLAIVVVFAIVYPMVDTHAPGMGSDDDDALNLGARALIAARFPYAERTYLGNALHHFAGAFVLAAPFVLVGTSALQNLVWLPLFFVAVRTETGDSRHALELAWLTLALSPAVMHDVVTGTGYASNSISVALGLWWLVRTRHRDAAAVAWGVTLASRANFFFLLPLAFGWLRHNVSVRAAVRATFLSCLTIALLTVPFYLHDPGNFGPLDAASRVFRFDAQIPHAGAALLALMTALAVGLSLTRLDTASLFRNCAWLQAFPIVAGFGLSSLQDGRIDLSYTRYGAFFCWFALMAIAARESAQRDEPLRRELVDEREQIGL
jgi:hypothetical protein